MTAHTDDGLTALRLPSGSLWVARNPAPIDALLRVRIEAKDVLLATELPRGLSALNVLSGHVGHIREGHGPGAMVQVIVGEASVLARVTKRSVARMNLVKGQPIHAIIKTVSVAQQNIGLVGNAALAERDTSGVA